MQTTYRAVEDALRAYLPATLVEQWERRPQQAALWGTWLTGSLMFCDISGFTAMSESLAQVGKEGAELMAAVLNRFFERMLAIADDWGGVQMKFGGDAMLLYFSEPGHADRAAAAGLDMQEAMGDFRRVTVGGNEYRLRMRIAIHSGRFYGASVGQPQGLLHYLLVGPDVNRTAAIEGAGEPGQVVVSAEAAAQMGAGCRLVPRDGVWRVRQLERPPRPIRKLHAPGPSNVLKQYILPPVAAPVLQGHFSSFSGEHRRVTAVFINVLGISNLLETEGEARALAQADAYVKIVMGAVERHGGFLAASDLAQEGDKLICLFGVPLSVEQEEKAALRAVLDLDRELRSSDLSLQHRIGVSSGFVFAGEIGSSRRREYTVIGDSVNLAARLMAASHVGEILVSRPTIDRAGPGFEAQRMRSLRVKGKAQPVPVFRLRSETSERRPEQVATSSTLVGRGEELATLLRLAQQVTSRGRGRWAYVWGEPGIGKSRLTQEVAGHLRGKGWREIVASCQLHTWHTPYAPWREPLRAVLGSALNEAPEDAWDKLNRAIGEAGSQLAASVPLLAELLSIPAPEEAAPSSLDPQERRRSLTSVVVELLEFAANRQPLMLVFEDAHWADALSLELLGAVAARRSRILVVTTSRQPTPPQELSAAGPPASMGLRELAPEAARSLVASASDLDERVIEKMVERAQGNPLFLQEIARMGVIRGESIPETVNDVILARLDRLPPEEKRVLRLASVIGPSFELEALHALAAGGLDPPRLEGALTELSELGFTREEAREPSSYAFSHILTREVAYETLPYAQRRQLHKRVGQHIEHQNAGELDGVCQLLLHHYDLADDAAKVVRYAAMSGDRAAAVFAIKESMDYYERSLSALAQMRKGYEGDRSLLLERLADCLDTTGRHGEAAKTFAEALDEWRAQRRRPRLVTAQHRPREREADLCRKVAVSLERDSDYDGALRWLDDALMVLPSRSPQVSAQVHSAKGGAFFRKGLYEQAVHWARRGVQLARGGGEPRELARAHHVLANSYAELGRLRQAVRHDRLAVRLYHELGDLPGQARANGNLGLSYQMLGVLDAALYHYELSLKASERIENLVVGAITHNNIGEVLMMMGRLDEAISHFEEVTRVYRMPGVMAVAGLAQVNLSRCSLRRWDLQGARLHLRRGLRLLRGVGAEGLLTEALLQKVELRLAAGDALKARRECRRVLSDAKALEAKVLEVRGERLLGQAEAALGDLERAAAHARASIAAARHAGAEYEEALSLLALARILRAGSDTRRQADGPLRRAITILSRMGAVLDLAEAKRLCESQEQVQLAAAS